MKCLGQIGHVRRKVDVLTEQRDSIEACLRSILVPTWYRCCSTGRQCVNKHIISAPPPKNATRFIVSPDNANVQKRQLIAPLLTLFNAQLF